MARQKVEVSEHIIVQHVFFKGESWFRHVHLEDLPRGLQSWARRALREAREPHPPGIRSTFSMTAHVVRPGEASRVLMVVNKASVRGRLVKTFIGLFKRG